MLSLYLTPATRAWLSQLARSRDIVSSVDLVEELEYTGPNQVDAVAGRLRQRGIQHGLHRFCPRGQIATRDLAVALQD
ncbi:hypothetical protein [Acidihalobacter yilgarnensis]|uniref:hypothetical protein n=1 Tax=Acidihalobacter yilgarnensis TaxID=2819280 RepID=UPI0012EA8EF6|nr:hypothetical protein [Acidihalobacter yilgarnensis]